MRNNLKKEKLVTDLRILVNSLRGLENMKVFPSSDWDNNKDRSTIYVKEKDFEKGKDFLSTKVYQEVSEFLFSKKIEDPFGFPEERVSDFLKMLETLETVRVESKFMGNYPGVYDYFLKLKQDYFGAMEGEHISKLPAHERVLVNAVRSIWGIQERVGTREEEAVLGFIKSHISTIKSISTTDKLSEFLEYHVWERYLKLIEDLEDKDKEESEKEEKKEEDKEKEAEPKKEEEKKKEVEDLAKDVEKKEVGMEEIFDKLNELGEKKEEPKEGIPVEVDKEKEVAPESSEEILQSYLTYESALLKINTKISVLSRKLGRILKDNEAERYSGNYRSGKLNHKSLYKWKTGASRIFSRKVERNKKDYVVSIVVDISGSMQGERIETAFVGAVLISEVLAKLKIPFEVVGFNEYLFEYKKMGIGLNWAQRRKLEEMQPDARGRGAVDNNDGFAIYKTTRDLLKYSQKRNRVMIVLSDGSPVETKSKLKAEHRKFVDKKHEDYSYYDFDLKTEVHKASRSCVVAGIGIQSKSVKKYYRNSKVVKELEDLPGAIVGVLDKEIKRY